MTDNRLGDIIVEGLRGHVVLLGFPYDKGVEINGGRPGAAAGPSAFRHFLKRTGAVFNPEKKIDLQSIIIADAGNVPENQELPQAHLILENRILGIFQSGGIPFAIGGSNDQSYPNISALLQSANQAPVGVINIDAHLDVRPLKEGLAHSGSPFRLLLEDSRFDGKYFIEFAAQGSQCSLQHSEFVLSHHGRIFWLEELQKNGAEEAFHQALNELAESCNSIFVSFDLDSVQGVDAPGVSCPGVVGLSAQQALNLACIAGNHPAVRLFDLSEYNPLIEKERTGRLAAQIFYNFCMGVASRKEAA